jgi:hypothetical protein
MTRTDVRQLLRRWTDAERDGDRDGLDGLLTEDFVGIGPVGFMLPKAAWLDRFGPELRHDRLELDEITRRDVVPAADGRLRIAGIQYSFMAAAAGAA